MLQGTLSITYLPPGSFLTFQSQPDGLQSISLAMVAVIPKESRPMQLFGQPKAMLERSYILTT